MEAQKQPRVYRSRTVKERLDGISDATLYRLMANHGFPKPRGKVGGGNLWDANEVDTWISQQLGGATT